MLAFVGCGGGGANEDAGGNVSPPPAPGDESRGPRLSLQEYTAQAAMICNEEMPRFRAIKHKPGVEATLENTRPLMKRLAAVFKTMTDRLSNLRPPERVESDVDRMLSAFAASAAGFQKVSEAEDMVEAERRFEEDAVANMARAHEIARRIGIDRGCEGP